MLNLKKVAGLIVVAIQPIILILIQTPFLDIFICLAIILIYYIWQGNWRHKLGFRGFSFSKSVGFGFLLAASFVIFTLLILLPSINFLTKSSLDISMLDPIRGNLNVYIPSLIIGWVVGAFCEEIIFRATLIGELGRIFGKAGAYIGIILSSVLFGYLHDYQGLTGQILTVVTGLFLAINYVRNDSRIWQNIMIHGFINTISLTLIFLDLDLF